MIAHCKPTQLSMFVVVALLVGVTLLACGPADETVQRKIVNPPDQTLRQRHSIVLSWTCNR